MKSCFRILVLATALLSWCLAGHAQTYPNRPIRVIIPYAPAGGADIIGRLVLDKVSKDTGFNFIVENRVGAGGNIAFAAIAAGQPDGYTLVIATPGLATNPTLYSKLPFSPADFTAITVIGESPLVFMVNPAMPVPITRIWVRNRSGSFRLTGRSFPAHARRPPRGRYGTREEETSTSRPMSIARTEWVTAPTET